MKPKSVKFRSVWIFQALPENYDILTEVPRRLAKGKRGDDWTASRFGDRMRKNDLVLLWRSGPAAGIYGTGRIVSDLDRSGDEPRIDLEFYPLLENPVLKAQLRQDPVLKYLSILKNARGTNFAVSADQWKRLQRLLGAPRSAGSAEIANAEDAGIPYNPRNQQDSRKRIMASIVQRRGQPEFRRRVMQIFNSRCLISGCDAGAVLEAAHICAYRGDHTNNPSNGLLLRADLHTLFDLYLIAIDFKKRRVLLAPTLKGTCYGYLNGQTIKIPNPGPSRQALDQHRHEFLRRIHQP